MNSGLTGIRFGISSRTAVKKGTLEFGLQFDRIVESVAFHYLDRTSNEIRNYTSVEIRSQTNLGSFCSKYNYFLVKPDSAKYKIKNALSVFCGIDFLVPWHSSIQTGFGGISYVTIHSVTVEVKPREIYYRRLVPRLNAGFTLSIMSRKNRPLFHLRTFWASDSFMKLGYRDITYKINNQLFKYEKSTLSVGGLYFMIIKDIIYLKKR